MAETSPIQLAVLISGSGTTLQNLIDRIADRSLNARINLVIASKSGIAGIDRAQSANIPLEIVERKQFDSTEHFSQEIFSRIERCGAQLVCLAGWLSLLEIPPHWHNRVMNIHPALLPSFGGRGMFGQRVHQAVLDYGCKVTGCTVHFVDPHYDNGPIILQRTCEVMDDDTPASLAHRLFEEEKIAYPQAIKLFQQGRLKIEGRRVRVLPQPK